MTKQPDLFDEAPSPLASSPAGPEVTVGEASSAVAQDGVAPSRGGSGRSTGPEETHGIQPVIALVTASSGFDSHQAPPSSSSYSPWPEVPQARFDSWSAAMQLAYCAARDEHAAADPYCTVEEVDFYLARAASYRNEALLRRDVES